jgi:hypothetical protein
MNAKKLCIVAALCGLLAFAVQAQSTEAPLISLENGFSVGYAFSSSDIGTTLDLTFGIGVADKVQALVSLVQGDSVIDDYRLLGLAYSVAPKLGIATFFGQGTASGNVVGLGLFSNLMSRGVAGGLQTGLKLRIDYLAPATSFDTGVFSFGLAASLGMM